MLQTRIIQRISKYHQTAATMTFTSIKSFGEIASLYDGFILDQFGVMHNGSQSLPGSVKCIEKLASMGKKLIILSNTSSPSETALRKLPKLGFDPDLFIDAVTSGQEAAHYIKEKYGSASNDAQAKKALWITWADPVVPLAFMSICGNIQVTTNVDEADFVIVHGTDVLRSQDGIENVSLGDYMKSGDLSVIDPILEACHKRGIPMVCANPDLIVKLPGDVTAHMPGKISKKYEAMGGDCTNFGKPHAEHFKACLRDLGLDADRVVHVGDSLHHDIAGANEAGISSIFITGGIHSDDFDCSIGEIPDKKTLQELFEKENQFPTHVAPLLQYL